MTKMQVTQTTLWLILLAGPGGALVGNGLFFLLVVWR